MHVSERRQYDMLVRVRDFGDKYGHLFPTSSAAAQNLAAVAAAIQELDAQETAHNAASVSARGHRKETARAALLARLQAICTTARVIAVDVTGLDQRFQVPNPAGDQMLLTLGRRFPQDAEPLTSRFVTQGMPATFLADLQERVGDLERALRDRGLGREERRAARSSTKAILASARAAVRSLNSIVINHFRDDVVTTDVWKHQRRIVYEKRAETAEPAPPAGAPETPTDSKAA